MTTPPSLPSLVSSILKRYLNQKDIVVIAVSGGPDSMSLLDLCLKTLGNKRIIAAHFNHRVRRESMVDQTLVETLCKKRKIIFEVESANVPAEAKKMKRGVEETGRMLRYSFLEKMRVKRKAKFILTAQHADDQVETILLHIIRGTNLHGLTGMRECERSLLRPLLSVRKKELLAYAKKNNIPFVIEATNLKTDTSRNLLRLKIIPLLEQINPGLMKTLLNTAGFFTDLEAYLSDEARRFLFTFALGGKLDQQAFRSLHVSLQRETLKTVHVAHYGSTEGLYSAELEEVRRFILTSVTGKKKRFGKKIELTNRNKMIFLLREEDI